MNKKIRRLGGVLLAVFALSGIAANGALAEPTFHSEASHTIGTGTQEGLTVFSVNSGTIHCSNVTGSGTITGNTATEATTVPVFKECRTTGFIEAFITIHMNGCYNVITADIEVHLICPAGKTMTATAPFCTISIPPQSATSVEYINVGTGATREVIAKEEANNIHYSESGFGCKETGTFSNGQGVGTARVTGENAEGKHVGIWWTDE